MPGRSSLRRTLSPRHCRHAGPPGPIAGLALLPGPPAPREIQLRSLRQTCWPWNHCPAAYRWLCLHQANRRPPNSCLPEHLLPGSRGVRPAHRRPPTHRVPRHVHGLHGDASGCHRPPTGSDRLSPHLRLPPCQPPRLGRQPQELSPSPPVPSGRADVRLHSGTPRPGTETAKHGCRSPSPHRRRRRSHAWRRPRCCRRRTRRSPILARLTRSEPDCRPHRTGAHDRVSAEPALAAPGPEPEPHRADGRTSRPWARSPPRIRRRSRPHRAGPARRPWLPPGSGRSSLPTPSVREPFSSSWSVRSRRPDAIQTLGRDPARSHRIPCHSPSVSPHGAYHHLSDHPGWYRDRRPARRRPIQQGGACVAGSPTPVVPNRPTRLLRNDRGPRSKMAEPSPRRLLG